jgi:hypothetical protein
MIKGVVSGFQPRSEQIGTGSGTRMLIVWDFRIERKDSTGQPMPRVAVEMRGTSFIGSISNGDVVEVNAAFSPGQVVEARQVRNLTSGAMVTAKGEELMRLSRLVHFVIVVPLFIAAVVFIVFVASVIFGGHPPSRFFR